MGRLGEMYERAYGALCGRHPDVRPWHFQWLALHYLHRDLREILPTLRGDVLDLGCGSQPYRTWLASGTSYVGADITAENGAEILLVPGEPLPFADASFDAVLCTQVLEHVEEAGQLAREMERVLRPGGVIVASAPFIFNQHGAPHDYRRFTRYGLGRLLPGCGIEQTRLQGGIGSSILILLLNWIEEQCNRSLVGRLAKGMLLPLWMVFSLGCNLAGRGLDAVDGTGSFYNNVLIVARKTV